MRNRLVQALVCGVLAGTWGLVPAHGSARAPGLQGTDRATGQGAGQDSGASGGRGQYAGMNRVMGEVTAVSGATLTVKTEDGSTVSVITTDNTRVVKDRGPVKVSDLHPGDGLMAMGNLDAPNKALHAAVVMAEDAAQIKAMRDNLGKTYITGRVTAVDLDNARMTVERSDHVAQTISFDEGTSFRRAVRGGGGSGGPGGSGSGGEGAGGPSGGGGSGDRRGGGFGGGTGMAAMMNGGIDRAFEHGESITLADIKTGDFVAATGAVKAGTFVPVHFIDTPPGQRRQRNGAGAGTPPGGTAPAGAASSPGPGSR